VAVVMMDEGCRQALAAITAAFGGARRIGLYQNDWTPARTDPISAVVPADFSGYDGLHDLLSWTVPVMDGDQAISFAAERLWTHNGGPVQNWIFGVYVVDAGGLLVWADRVWNDPVPMIFLGNLVRYVPCLTQKSKLPGR
jgi:hypothetical protein